jgi:16S rRNA (adenine1518-N6/adenine1519-N6)-dimethyltransferase
MSSHSEHESIPKLLKRYGLRPSKGLGQNFLADPGALRKVIAAAEVTASDAVLEVGPGLGSLTRLLAAEAARVAAVELDAGMIGALGDLLKGVENVELIHADILEVDLASLFPSGEYLVVANIPYYITSALLRHLLEAPNPPTRLVLTVQREVAERICARQGDLSLLALSVQVYGEPRIAGRIPAGAFYPPPKVDSAVVRIDLYPRPLIAKEQLNDFFRLIKAGFGQKRKTLRNSLSAGLGQPKEAVEELLAKAGIDSRRRAQTLSMEEWGKLVREYSRR